MWLLSSESDLGVSISSPSGEGGGFLRQSFP